MPKIDSVTFLINLPTSTALISLAFGGDLPTYPRGVWSVLASELPTYPTVAIKTEEDLNSELFFRTDGQTRMSRTEGEGVSCAAVLQSSGKTGRGALVFAEV